MPVLQIESHCIYLNLSWAVTVSCFFSARWQLHSSNSSWYFNQTMPRELSLGINTLICSPALGSLGWQTLEGCWKTPTWSSESRWVSPTAILGRGNTITPTFTPPRATPAFQSPGNSPPVQLEIPPDKVDDILLMWKEDFQWGSALTVQSTFLAPLTWAAPGASHTEQFPVVFQAPVYVTNWSSGGQSRPNTLITQHLWGTLDGLEKCSNPQVAAASL